MPSQELKDKADRLPDAPGVYFFLGDKKKILYIGKATSLRGRVKSYFAKDLMSRRGPLIAKMVEEAKDVRHIETPSVLEALILEASEIKKHQPYHNSREKDDRSYNYVVITKEDFPRILIKRGRELSWTPGVHAFGPFPHASELREALKIIRKIFPYRDEKCPPRVGSPSRVEAGKIGKVPKPCFPAQLGLCPGPCAGWISKAEYRKNIKHIRMLFEAKKPKLIESLEKEMKKLAKERKFEEAEKIKRQIFALEHIQDIALIKRDLQAASSELQARFRIEAYDIAHISGTNAVGVMTVVEDGEANKSQYRKFKIRADKNDDVANLREVLSRRLKHPEWPMPDLVVVDGGKAQVSAALEVIEAAGEEARVVSVVKDERHKAREILYLRDRSPELEKSILLANAEAHRFAINYHRLLRRKGFRI